MLQTTSIMCLYISLQSQWFGGIKNRGQGSCRCYWSIGSPHFYDEEAVDCRKDFTWIVIFTLACIALGCLTMLVAYYFNKLKQPHQIGTNVASKGTEMSMNSYFGASTASTVSTASTASSMYPMDAYTKNDGLIRGQDPWFIRANSHY